MPEPWRSRTNRELERLREDLREMTRRRTGQHQRASNTRKPSVNLARNPGEFSHAFCPCGSSSRRSSPQSAA